MQQSTAQLLRIRSLKAETGQRLAATKTSSTACSAVTSGPSAAAVCLLATRLLRRSDVQQVESALTTARGE